MDTKFFKFVDFLINLVDFPEVKKIDGVLFVLIEMELEFLNHAT